MIYKDYEIDIDTINYNKGIAIIPLPSGEIVCIPEEIFTQEERQLVDEYIKLHANDTEPEVVEPLTPVKTELEILRETVDALVLASLGV